MPPHCDSLDGPVVTAARKALETGQVQLVLPYVSQDADGELRRAFDLAVGVRASGSDAAAVADVWFFETAVRLHRAGEGAPFTGLKPAGLDTGPVIPAAERALETGSPEPLVEVLCGIVRDQIESRLARAVDAEARADESLAAAREHVGAALGLQVWAQGVFRQATADPHPHSAAGTDGDRVS